MLELLGLADKAGTLTERLSGGQAQRLAIACAVVHSPELVFLDEPTAGLDPQARRNLWDVLRDMNVREGRTVVLTTHFMDEAEELCHRVAIMDAGRILRADPPSTLIRTRRVDPDSRSAAAVCRWNEAGSCSRTPPWTGEAGVSRCDHDPSAVVYRTRPARRAAGLAVRGASLEDVFLAVTGREYRS